jgi:hypothetical protein
MLGSIGLTCAFPFDGDELYGQHVTVHVAQAGSTTPYQPTFFTSDEYALVSRVTDVLIPQTATPGAAAAGVPEYIDRVVSLNKEHQSLIRAGLGWLEQQAKSRYSRDWMSLEESEQIAILQPLSDEVDRQRREQQRQRFRPDAKGTLVYYVPVTDKNVPTPAANANRPPVSNDASDKDFPIRLFRLLKNLTADGYYTSRVGLVEELGYSGNTMLGRFPSCSVPEQ